MSSGTTRGCRIEPAGPADLDALVQLLGELFTLEQDFRVEPAKQRRGLEMLLGDPNRAAVLVARDESGGPALAMVTGQLVISTAEGGASILVEDLIVSRALRGRGVGRALLGALLDWGRARGATRAQLLADTHNDPALAFYDHLGWRRIGMLPWRLPLPPAPEAMAEARRS
jgi:ribosomal protein S18 acetylase RimI-like enzyme